MEVIQKWSEADIKDRDRDKDVRRHKGREVGRQMGKIQWKKRRRWGEMQRQRG